MGRLPRQPFVSGSAHGPVTNGISGTLRGHSRRAISADFLVGTEKIDVADAGPIVLVGFTALIGFTANTFFASRHRRDDKPL